MCIRDRPGTVIKSKSRLACPTSPAALTLLARCPYRFVEKNEADIQNSRIQSTKLATLRGRTRRQGGMESKVRHRSPTGTVKGICAERNKGLNEREQASRSGSCTVTRDEKDPLVNKRACTSRDHPDRDAGSIRSGNID